MFCAVFRAWFVSVFCVSIDVCCSCGAMIWSTLASHASLVYAAAVASLTALSGRDHVSVYCMRISLMMAVRCVTGSLASMANSSVTNCPSPHFLNPITGSPYCIASSADFPNVSTTLDGARQ